MEVNQRVEISPVIDQKFITMISEDLYKHRSCQYLITIASNQHTLSYERTNVFGNYKSNYSVINVDRINVEDEVQVFKDNIILFDQTMFRGINLDSVLG